MASERHRRYSHALIHYGRKSIETFPSAQSHSIQKLQQERTALSFLQIEPSPFPQCARQCGVTEERLLLFNLLGRGVCAVIRRFFWPTEIAVAKMLLFFRESVAIDILTKRDSNRCRDRCQSLPSADESIQRLLRSGMRSQSCVQSLGP